MSFADFQALMAEAAQQPAVILICGLLVFIAGMLAGLTARREEDALEAEEAGDTHAHLPSRLPPSPREMRMRAAAAAQTRRVRGIGADLRPSYDGRKTQPKT
jgi:hypothetical protein